MTTREQYAMAAMQALISNTTWTDIFMQRAVDEDKDFTEQVAELSFQYAKSMEKEAWKGRSTLPMF